MSNQVAYFCDERQEDNMWHTHSSQNVAKVSIKSIFLKMVENILKLKTITALNFNMIF